jgi:hypothetical protein
VMGKVEMVFVMPCEERSQSLFGNSEETSYTRS